MASQVAEEVPYLFNRGFRSSIRLNYNHWMWKSIFGYLIHPSVRVHHSEMRVADVGTGTGIWALETAFKLSPTVYFHGFDISGDQLPVLHGVDNVSFSEHNCFQPFPKEHLGQYDIVNARAWLCLLGDAEAPRLLKNMVTLLKPGGYIQWLEPLPLSARTVKPNAEMPTPALDRLVKSWHKPQEHSEYSWVERLPDLFQDHNLSIIANDRRELPPHYRLIWGHSQLAGLEDTVSDVRRMGQERMDQAKSWMVEIRAEYDKGAGADVPFVCVVGRKRPFDANELDPADSPARKGLDGFLQG